MKVRTTISHLKVGIAGYGVIGKRRHIYVDQHPHLKTVAVCDEKFKDCGNFDSGIRYYQTYEQLLEKEDLDVILVSLPNYLAPDVTIAALRTGHHVFCEKPPASNLEDMKRVQAVSKEFPGLKIKYGFNHRYHDSVQDTLKIIRSGMLGDIINLRGIYGKSFLIFPESTWRAQREISGGGILLDQGIHMIDLMRLFAGEFDQIHSFIEKDYWKYNVEDNAYILMRQSQTGVVAMMHSTATEWRHRFQLFISFTKGSIILSGILSGSKSYGAETLSTIYRGESDKGNPREEIRNYIKDNSWRLEIEDFADAILRDHPIRIGNIKDAYKTLELIFKIYYSDPAWRERYGIMI